MGQSSRPLDPGVAIGHVFGGKYRVDEILGHGGMGVVARCMHLALNEQVAIKMLRKDVLLDRDAVERFTREAQAAVKLRSEYVARVLDVGTFENGVPYMVMEFLDGHDLGELIDTRGCLPGPWATELVLQAAEALSEAHSLGIVHRDVKPANLFVTWRPDGSALIKVLDFGISKAPVGTDLQLTQTQSLLGTPAYMSPEQMRSARLVDARSDIWSLGTVMYELLEGQRPFEAESFSEMCVKVAVDPPLPMVNTPPALQQVVLRCLAKSPEQRYSTMAELGRDLVPFAQDPQQAAMLVERMQRTLDRRWETSGRWALPVIQPTPVPAPRTPTPLPAAPPPPAPPPPAPPPGDVEPVAYAGPDVSGPVGRTSELIETARPRRKKLAVLAAAALIAIAIALMFGLRRGGDPAPEPIAKPTDDEVARDRSRLAEEQRQHRDHQRAEDERVARLAADKAAADKLAADKAAADKLAADKAAADKALTMKRSQRTRPDVKSTVTEPDRPKCDPYKSQHGCPRT